ncbi:MAG: glycosyltransferase family 4 protein [Candidatus Zixiibacteriota bacterium]|nr:MAG: glycosyltransferase family 4 protein [candidate division Zixibacteria bacterium]
MRKCRTAFICPSKSWGGLEMNVFRLAGWLKERGRPMLFYGYPGTELYRNFQKAGFDVKKLRSTSKFGDALLSVPLSRMLRADRADIAVVHLNKNLLLGALAKKFSRRSLKLVYMQHMHVGGKKRDPFHRWLHRQIDAWVTPLEMFKDTLLEKTGLEPSRIAVIPLGVELDRFVKRPDKPAARNKLGIPQDVPLAGVIGRLDPKKGQHILIEACRRLHDSGTPLHVLIVGDQSRGEQTGYGDRLHHLTGRLGLTDYVYFRPHTDDIETVFAALDIFALTSQSETYGMVTIEAMASGLPVIATSEGGTPGIVAHEQNGLLIEPGSVAQLVEALKRLIHDKPLSQTLAAQAQEDARTRFSHRRQCDLLEKLFDDLTGRSA